MARLVPTDEQYPEAWIEVSVRPAVAFALEHHFGDDPQRQQQYVNDLLSAALEVGPYD